MKKRGIFIFFVCISLLFAMSSLTLGAVTWGGASSCMTDPSKSSKYGLQHHDSDNDGDVTCDFCGTEHPHSFLTTTGYPTCITNGYKKETCECGKIVEETIWALGHDFSHKTCVNPTDDISNHKQKCNRCGTLQSSVTYPTDFITENVIAGTHKPYCPNCKEYGSVKSHTWTGGDYISKTPHKCIDCGYERTKYPYHAFLINTLDANCIDKKCIVIGCSEKFEVESASLSSAKDLAEYSCVGSNVPYIPDTEISAGTTYTLQFSHPETNEAGEAVDLNLLAFTPRFYLYKYTRQNVEYHRQYLASTEGVQKANKEAFKDFLDQHSDLVQLEVNKQMMDFAENPINTLVRICGWFFSTKEC